MLYNDYFADVREHDPWFRLKKDCVGLVGFSSLQNCFAAMRMFLYGAPADGQDDYLHMSESTTIHAMYRLCGVVVAVFGPQYLRAPDEEETAWILTVNEAR